jgi:hypothetical protein
MKRPHIERVEIDDPEALALTSDEMIRWLNSWTLEENMRYGGQYVAVSSDHKVVASDRSSKKLAQKLRDLGSPRVLVFLLEAPGERVIY